jgi:hypothetical protein
MNPERNFKVLEGTGRGGARCKVCMRFIRGGSGEVVLDLNHGTEKSTIVCSVCARKIAALAAGLPSENS